MVKTPSFHCRGARVRSPVGELRSCMPCGQKKKKNWLINCDTCTRLYIRDAGCEVCGDSVQLSQSPQAARTNIIDGAA